jgi:hypothetical protein
MNSITSKLIVGYGGVVMWLYATHYTNAIQFRNCILYLVYFGVMFSCLSPTIHVSCAVTTYDFFLFEFPRLTCCISRS